MNAVRLAGKIIFILLQKGRWFSWRKHKKKKMIVLAPKNNVT